jgi:hypothetical protein
MWERILTVIGSVASLVSLGVSIYVAWSLRIIKNKYIFRAKAPKFVRALSSHASTLIGYGNDFANSRQKISVELTRIDVRTRAMQGRMHGAPKRAVKQLRKLIKDYRRGPDNVEGFYAIYDEMQRVIEEVKELREDLDLEL